MNLPKDSKIRNMLAFYWYQHGPYSESIADGINSMIVKNLVQKINKSDIKIYKYSQEAIHTRLIRYDKDLEQAVSLIIQKVNEFRNMNDVIYSMYSNDAPYALYSSYKNEFSNKFENFCNHLFGNHNISEIRSSPADIEDVFLQVILDIPHDEYFRDFRYSLNLYSQGLLAILSHELLYNQSILELLREAFDLHGMIWIVFASGVRVQHYDAYYDNKVGGWNEKFEKELNALQQKNNDFHVHVFEQIKDKAQLPSDLDYPDKPKNAVLGYPPNIALEKIKEITGY